MFVGSSSRRIPGPKRSTTKFPWGEGVDLCLESFLQRDWLICRTRTSRLPDNRAECERVRSASCFKAKGFQKPEMPRTKRSKSFYSDLNRLSTADFYVTNRRRSRTLPGVFQAERLVCMKEQRKVSVLKVIFVAYALNFIRDIRKKKLMD